MADQEFNGIHHEGVIDLIREKPGMEKVSEGLLTHVHLIGNNSAHGYTYTQESHAEAHKLFEGLVVGIDHDFDPNKGEFVTAPVKVGNTWGTVEGPITFDENGCWGNLRFLTKHEQTPTILEALEKGIGPLALSPVNQFQQKGNKVLHYRPVRVDLVVGGATTKSLFEGTIPGEDKEESKEEVKEECKAEGQEPADDAPLLQAVLAVLKHDGKSMVEKEEEITALFGKHMEVEAHEQDFKTWKQSVEERLVALKQPATVTVHEQTISPCGDLAQEINQVTAGIDLHKFWND